MSSKRINLVPRRNRMPQLGSAGRGLVLWVILLAFTGWVGTRHDVFVASYYLNISKRLGVARAPSSIRSLVKWTTPAVSTAKVSVPPATVAQVALAKVKVITDAPEVSKLETEIQSRFKGSRVLKGLTLDHSGEGLSITFRTDRIFALGRAVLERSAETDVRSLVSVIRDEAENYEIRVEGHTDDLPVVRNRNQFLTNWELSGARAAAIVRVFETAGVSKDRLEAISFGESRPQVLIDPISKTPDAVSRSINRRLVIRLIRRPDHLHFGESKTKGT